VNDMSARILLAAALLAPAAARADWTEHLALSGFAQSDLRFDVEDYRGPVAGKRYAFSANRTDVGLLLQMEPAAGLSAIVDGRLRYRGFVEADRLVQTTERDLVDPFSMQLDRAFLAVKGKPWKWLDLRIGRMVQTWGTADMFSPVDILSARDLSDPLDYTRKVPNQMIQADAYPASWLSLSAVFIPVFKPSQLPPSAGLAFAMERDPRGCLAAAPAPPLGRADAQRLAALFASTDPCALDFEDPQVRLVLPDNGIADAQAALRAKLKLGDLDLGLTYYYGRFSFPVAYTAVAKTAPSDDPARTRVQYVAEVVYPRMQVAGLDFSYSAEWLWDVGVTGEVAAIFPEEVDFALRAYVGDQKVFGATSVNVPSTPFLKATLGLEYTFASWLAANAMYVHGFFDEFADAYGLHDYVLVVPRMSFLDDSLKLQISAILDLTDLSKQENPELVWVPVPGAELSAGGWWFAGSTRPKDPIDYGSREKFGQKAAGRSVAYLRAKVTW